MAYVFAKFDKEAHNGLVSIAFTSLFPYTCMSIVTLLHLFPVPCGAGSAVPREGFDSSVIMPFSWCIVAVTLPI